MIITTMKNRSKSNITENTVKTRLFYARVRLKSVLDKYLE